MLIPNKQTTSLQKNWKKTQKRVRNIKKDSLYLNSFNSFYLYINNNSNTMETIAEIHLINDSSLYWDYLYLDSQGIKYKIVMGDDVMPAKKDLKNN